MLFCDFNLSENFVIDEAQTKLCKSFVITKSIKSDKNMLVKKPKTEHFTRLNIEYDKSLNIKTLSKYKDFDIISIQVNDFSDIKYVIDLSPDLITFDLRQTNLVLKPGYIRDAINRGIYFEITTRECLYNKKLEWLKNVTNLLGVTKGRGTVLSSGSEYSTEFKSRCDMFCMLRALGLSERRAIRVLDVNSNDLLERCAMKRFTYRGVLAHNEDQGKLKSDYILNKLAKN